MTATTAAYIVGHRHTPLIKFVGRRLARAMDAQTRGEAAVTRPAGSSSQLLQPGPSRFPHLPLTPQEIECVQVSTAQGSLALT